MSVVLRGSTVNSFYRRSNHRRANVSGHMSSHEVGSAKSRSGQSGRVITAKPHRDVKSVEDLTNHVIPNFGMGNSDRLPNLEKTKSDSGAAAGFFIPTDFLPIVSLKFKTFFSSSLICFLNCFLDLRRSSSIQIYSLISFVISADSAFLKLPPFFRDKFEKLSTNFKSNLQTIRKNHFSAFFDSRFLRTNFFPKPRVHRLIFPTASRTRAYGSD